MQVHEIPRDYRGESRILYIFSTKALLYTAIGAIPGVVLYFILKMLNVGTIIGIIITIFFGFIGFSIGTFKIPDSHRFKLTEKAGGENIDEIIKRVIKFRKKRNRIYVYKKEETKDE